MVCHLRSTHGNLHDLQRAYQRWDRRRLIWKQYRHDQVQIVNIDSRLFICWCDNTLKADSARYPMRNNEKIQGWHHPTSEGRHDQTVDTRGPEHRTHPSRSTSNVDSRLFICLHFYIGCDNRRRVSGFSDSVQFS